MTAGTDDGTEAGVAVPRMRDTEQRRQRLAGPGLDRGDHADGDDEDDDRTDARHPPWHLTDQPAALLPRRLDDLGQRWRRRTGLVQAPQSRLRATQRMGVQGAADRCQHAGCCGADHGARDAEERAEHRSRNGCCRAGRYLRQRDVKPFGGLVGIGDRHDPTLARNGEGGSRAPSGQLRLGSAASGYPTRTRRRHSRPHRQPPPVPRTPAFPVR